VSANRIIENPKNSMDLHVFGSSVAPESLKICGVQ
jgi:hypothetical protein